ncbi:HNH endonuclease family protein [Loigolactobacillus iwatensis]|uniref:HNH endonuclease n=1 Tax=Loigolactobacillus iwatensis TaxID=1267156 RepID=UPI000F7E668A|nr:HNH endonuclease [Loigolactobacillus iwatensis]
MQAFIVMQGRTYQAERAAGIIWTYQNDQSGQLPPSWARLAEVQPGDIVFHYVAGALVALSQVTAPLTSSLLPEELVTDGARPIVRLVQLHYYELPRPIQIKQILPLIRPLLPQQHSAFQQNGAGNQGYLYPCYAELTQLFLQQIEQNYFTQKNEQLQLSMSTVTSTIDNPLLAMIVKARLVLQAQVGAQQKLFRQRVFQQQVVQCAICGVETPTLLKAVRLKPTKDSPQSERILAENGLILCPIHAALVEQGYLSFSRGGKLMPAANLALLDRERLLPQPKLRLAFTAASKPFLNWHRQYLFHGLNAGGTK